MLLAYCVYCAFVPLQQVVSYLHVRPLNGSMQPTSAAASSVTVDITGCSSLASLAAANPISAAAISQNASSYSIVGSSGAKMALPVVTLQLLEVKPVTSYMWSVKNTPITGSIKLLYKQAFRATFMVQYKRSAAPPGVAISGQVLIRNPNLLDPLQLAQVHVELSAPGATGPVARAWASCPRDEHGGVAVTGQLVGSGTLSCSWSMEVLVAGDYGYLIASGTSAQLMAVACTSTGREAVSPAVPYSSVPARSPDAKPAGACAALMNGFQLVGPGGERLLAPSSSSGSGSVDLLPGEAGGGRAADVVCDSLSVSYGATYGPLAANQCGSYKVSIGHTSACKVQWLWRDSVLLHTW